MSIKQNFPTIDSTLNLDFANSRVVDSRITFTRASAATVTDANGIIQTVRDNKPRIDFDATTGECRGLLIEEQRTNVQPYSNNFTNAEYTKTDVTLIPNAIVAPDGSLTGCMVTGIGTGNSRIHTLGGGIYGTTYASGAISFYAKAGTLSVVSIGDNGYGNRAAFNLSTGLVTFSAGSISASMVSVGNGWFRCTAVYAFDYQYRIFYLQLGATYPGIATTGSVYMWGCQIEVNSTFPTSYIPTTPTFTSRASSATYYDSTGVLRTAPVNNARYGFGYDSTTQKWVSQGLILEAAATNLVDRSTVSNIGSAWQQYDCVLTANYSTAPDGSYTAGRVVATNSATVRVATTGLVTSGVYAASIWVKSNTGSNYTFILEIGDTSVVSITATPQWQRFSGFGSPQQNGYNFIDLQNVPTGTDISVWGAQLETGTLSTSYIPTISGSATRAADVSTSAATTRSRDNAEMYNIDQSWFKNSEGSFYAEGYHSARNSSSLLAVVPGITNTWTTGMMQLSEFNAGSTSGFRIYTSINGATATGQIDPGVTTLSTGVNHKVAGAWRTNDAASSVNTTAISTDNTVILPGNLSTLKIGSSYDSGFKINGCIKKIVYYPIRLSNTQLQALTV